MRKILKTWPSQQTMRVPLSGFVADVSAALAAHPDAIIEIHASGDTEGCAEFEIEITRPETDIEKSLRQGARMTDHRFKL